MSSTTAHRSKISGRTPLDVAVLRSKAADLRLTAAQTDPPLASAYRRRAAELELEATALAARFGLVEEVALAA